MTAPDQTADPAAPSESPDFESALQRLEEIVRQLERGEAKLEDSIRLFEEGNRLRALCQARLDAARARIELIAANAEGRATDIRPFDAD